MSFQFCCPQGHVLQGDLSQVGQLFQCPMCGSSFLIPPPEMGPVPAGGFYPVPGTWPAANAPAGSFPVQGGMPGMMPPQTMPMMPGGPTAPGPTPAGSYPLPGPQPFAFNPGGSNPMSAGLAAAPAARRRLRSSQRPRCRKVKRANRSSILDSIPNAKAALPFDLPGHGEPEAEQPPAAPLPAALAARGDVSDGFVCRGGDPARELPCTVDAGGDVCTQ